MANRDFEGEAKEWRCSHVGYNTESVVTSLYKRILILEDRIDKLQPTDEQLDKYPSLKEAYEQFIIIRRLTIENDK